MEDLLQVNSRYMHICVYVYTYTHMYVLMYINVCIATYVCICTLSCYKFMIYQTDTVLCDNQINRVNMIIITFTIYKVAIITLF